ncbi:MAG: dTDP-4-dehydrorhamnose 3,5-epimerase [Candidatus Omnitrophota bacterium]
MAFQFEQLSIPGVVLITPDMFQDHRGIFEELYKQSDFEKQGIPGFVQANHSQSGKNVLRGLHYQLPPYAQGKLVQVISGEIFDVAVDIRKGSPFYGQWAGEILSSENRRMIYIPEGFAHGFSVISETADIIYYCTAEYSAGSERGIVYNDADIAIKWPTSCPVLSEKDKRLPELKNAENEFEYR